MKVGYMRFLAAALLAVSLVVPAISIAEEMDLNSAINKSGRQRMLSQRMTKAYCRIGLNIRRDEAEKQLSDAIPLFERQLADLKAFSPSGPINAALANVEAKWTPFKQIVTKPYNRDSVARLLDLNEELLQATERVVRLYEEQ